MSSKQKIWAVLALIAGAIGWGLIWYPYRLLQQAGISGAVSACITYFLALLPGLVLFRRELRAARHAPWLLLWLALAAGWTNLAYVLAVIHGEVMRVMLLFYVAPLWTVIFARLLLNETPRGAGWLVMLLSLAGAVTMLWHPSGGLPLPRSAAEWLGLSAGLMFALSNVLVRKDRYHGIPLKSLAVWAGVAAVSLGYMVLMRDFPPAAAAIAAPAWWLLGALGAVIFLLNLVVQYGITHTPANQAIVILLFELVVAAVASYFLAGEAMALQEWIGGAMIVSASLFSGKLEQSRR